MADLKIKNPVKDVKPFDRPVNDYSEDDSDFNCESNRILRYFTKPEKTGKITVAHLKCLKPVGNDYKKLFLIKKKRERGEDISEVIDRTDAEFDQEKVKALFQERGLCRRERFDTRIQNLRAIKMIQQDNLKAQKLAVDMIDLIKPVVDKF